MAPAFIALTVIGMSPCPVMKMIGRCLLAAESSRWNSRPLCPGILISTTRQVGRSGSSPLLKKSEADENCRVERPTDRNSRTTDSRNSASSSMIKTQGLASGVAVRFSHTLGRCLMIRVTFGMAALVRLSVASRHRERAPTDEGKCRASCCSTG